MSTNVVDPKIVGIVQTAEYIHKPENMGMEIRESEAAVGISNIKLTVVKASESVLPHTYRYIKLRKQKCHDMGILLYNT